MRVFVPVLFWVTAAAAADISGSWSIDGSLNGNPISFDCTFRQNEKKISGSCKAYDLDAAVTGTVEEDVVRFSFLYNFAGVPYTCTYTGKLEGNSEVRGSIVVSGVEGSKGEFVAKKS